MNEVQKYVLDKAMQKVAGAGLPMIVNAGLPMVRGSRVGLRPAIKALLALLGIGAGTGVGYGILSAADRQEQKKKAQLAQAQADAEGQALSVRDAEMESIGNIVNEPEVAATTGMGDAALRAIGASAGTSVGALGGLGVNKLLGNTSTKSKIISALIGATTLGTAGALAPEIRDSFNSKGNA